MGAVFFVPTFDAGRGRANLSHMHSFTKRLHHTAGNDRIGAGYAAVLFGPIQHGTRMPKAG